MPGPETIRDYLDTVTAQIRWKRARAVAVRELGTHLEDQRNEFQAEGRSPEEAERLAVEEMGDPVAVGTDLDRLHRPKSQWKMLCLLAAALGLWLVLRLAERWGVSYWSEYVVSFGGIVLLAAGLAAGIYLLDYTLLAKAALPLAVLLTAAAALGGRLQFQMGCTYDLGQYIILLLPVAMALAVYGLRSRGREGSPSAACWGCCRRCAICRGRRCDSSGPSGALRRCYGSACSASPASWRRG